MPLPEFDEQGDLPVGVYQVTLAEVLTRVGHGTPQRQAVTAQFVRIYELARATGKLLRFVIFGSYVTAKPAPNDIDIVLVMRDDFEVAECDAQAQPLFDHLRAQQLFSASVFAVRPSTALLATVDEFISYWQIKRDQSKRGIIEVRVEEAK
jgi:hypothetical protein